MAKANCTAPVPAVGYLRKSTAGENAQGRERQEKSIPQQKAEIEKLAANTRSEQAPYGFRIIRWYADPGISGWKRGAKRPDFDRMLTEAREKRDFRAILCDDIDRFSRADSLAVHSDAHALREAGVRFIVTAAQGLYDLHGNDAGGSHGFLAAVMSSHDFSRKLSRRISLSRRNRAREGKRSGGAAPYGLANDGNGGLKFGDPAKLNIVVRIFREFVTELRSLNSITARLNAEGIPASRGGKWYVSTVKEVLTQRAYCGDFTYNRKKSGRFYIVDAAGEVVEADNRPSPVWKPTDVGMFAEPGRYEPAVDPDVYQRAQERLGTFSLKGGKRRPRDNGYPLSRILICDHCGKPMYGCHPTGRKHRVYRCSTPAKSGMGTCGTYEIREELILPYVMKVLGEEITNLDKLLPAPPAALTNPNGQRDQQRRILAQEREKLAATIAQAEENLLFVSDARTRRSLDARISTLRDQLEQMDAELGDGPEAAPGYSLGEVQALRDWWREFDRSAVTLPVTGKLPLRGSFYLSPESDPEDTTTSLVMVGPRELNEALHGLGAEVRLRWRTDKVPLAQGIVRNRHTLVGGRVRLGQRNETFRKVPFEESNSGNLAADRCETRRDTG
jgi:site-specific DNA recombinase